MPGVRLQIDVRDVSDDDVDAFSRIPSGEADNRRRTNFEKGPTARDPVKGLFLPPCTVW